MGIIMIEAWQKEIEDVTQIDFKNKQSCSAIMFCDVEP